MRIPTEHSVRSGVLAACAVWSLSATCAAQTPTPRASLVVTRSDGAQDCPDAATLAEQVRGVAGVNVIGAGLANGPGAPLETWVQVAIARDFSGYRAQISALGVHHGTRALEDLGPGCGSLADAVAVTIAIFLDPYANTPLPPPPVVASPAALPPAAPPTKPAPAHEAPSRPALVLDASGGVALGMLEHSKPVLTASVGAYWAPRWSLALGASYVFADTVSDANGDVALGLSYGFISGCGRALGARDTARVDFCAAPMLGVLSGSGRNYAFNASYHPLWLAFAAGPELVFPITSALSWVLSGEGVLPLIQRNFTSDAAGAKKHVFRSSSVAGFVSLGIRGAL